MKATSPLLAVCAAAVLCLPLLARASVVYSFSGVVDDDDAGRSYVAFTGSFSFDANALDQISDPSTADYKAFGLPFGMSVVFDGSTSRSLSDMLDILVSNNLSGTDQFGVLARDGSLDDALGLTLTDYSQSAFGSDALPLPVGGLTLAMFDVAQFTYETSGNRLTGHLTALRCVTDCDTGSGTPVPTAIPEPTTPALVVSGLGLMALAARRSRIA